jgi:hypothetical protein
MPKTPDEIKKGLECCMDYQSCTECGEPKCPYNDVKECVDTLLADALALIQQLETDKQQLEGVLTHMNQLRDAAAGRALKMEERVHQLEAERDQVVKDLHYLVNHPQSAGPCYACKHTDECYSGGDCDPVENDRWEWRGVQKEE